MKKSSFNYAAYKYDLDARRLQQDQLRRGMTDAFGHPIGRNQQTDLRTYLTMRQTQSPSPFLTHSSAPQVVQQHAMREFYEEQEDGMVESGGLLGLLLGLDKFFE